MAPTPEEEAKMMYIGKIFTMIVLFAVLVVLLWSIKGDGNNPSPDMCPE